MSLQIQKLDEANNIAQKQEQQDDKSYQGPLDSTLGHLGSFLRSALSATLALCQGFVSGIPEGLTGALKGLSENC